VFFRVKNNSPRRAPRNYMTCFFTLRTFFSGNSLFAFSTHFYRAKIAPKKKYDFFTQKFVSPIGPLLRRGGSVFLTFFSLAVSAQKMTFQKKKLNFFPCFFIGNESRGGVDVIPWLSTL